MTTKTIETFEAHTCISRLHALTPKHVYVNGQFPHSLSPIDLGSLWLSSCSHDTPRLFSASALLVCPSAWSTLAQMSPWMPLVLQAKTQRARN